MTKAGERLLAGAKEAVAFAKGEEPAARITVNGHTYVPLADLQAAERERDEWKRRFFSLRDMPFMEAENPEDRWGRDTENACPCCGGSGHKDGAARPDPDGKQT